MSVPWLHPAPPIAWKAKGAVHSRAHCIATHDMSLPRCPLRSRLQGQWVKQAFVQAKARMRRVAQLNTPALASTCDFDGIAPIHGCYNSILPGTLAGPQVAGQYGERQAAGEGGRRREPAARRRRAGAPAQLLLRSGQPSDRALPPSCAPLQALWPRCSTCAPSPAASRP